MGAPKIHPESEGLGFKIRVIAAGEPQAAALARELEQSLHDWVQLEVGWDGDGQVLFVDAGVEDLDARLAGLDRNGTAVFLIVRDGDEVPAALVEARVDDVLVYPFRPLEVLSKLRHYQRMLDYRDSIALNVEYGKVVERLQEDLKLAERLQKQRLPRRFPEVKGFKVTSRYMAGVRSGGDYVDLAETRDGSQLAIVMTDASSYRLSSAVLDSISRRLASLSVEETRSCVTAARRIRDGVLQTLGDRDHLSLFYGVLSRKDYKLKFLNLGSNRVFYAPPGKSFGEFAAQGDPIVRAMSVRTDTEGELTLEPEGRLVLVSDGFVDAAGGSAGVLEILNRFRGQEAVDALNELVFRVKSVLAGPEDLPAQDCTAVLFDVDSRLLRLA